jgi:DNA repair ATPase RecN
LQNEALTAAVTALEDAVASQTETVAGCEREREKMQQLQRTHEEEREMLGTQLTNLAFMQLELMEDERLKFRLKTVPVLNLLAWAARARAKNDDSLPPSQRISSVYTKEEPAEGIDGGQGGDGTSKGTPDGGGGGDGSEKPSSTRLVILTLPHLF